MNTGTWNRWMAVATVLALVFTLAPASPVAAQGGDDSPELFLPHMNADNPQAATPSPEPGPVQEEESPEETDNAPQPQESLPTGGPDQPDGASPSLEQTLDAPLPGQEGEAETPATAAEPDSPVEGEEGDYEPPTEFPEEPEPESGPDESDAAEAEGAAFSPAAEDEAAVYDVIGQWRVSGRLGVGTDVPVNKIHAVTSSNWPDGVLVRNEHLGNAATTQVKLETAGALQGLEIYKFGPNNAWAWDGIPLADWARIRVEDNAKGIIIATGGARPLIFGTNDHERIRLTSGGRLGLGTSTPGYKLDVHINNGSALNAWSEAGVYAMRAYNSAPAGTRYGIYSEIESTSGYAGFFRADAETGSTRGIYVDNDSTSGTAGLFVADASSGTTYGVFADNDSPDGYAVWARHDASTGTAPAVYGRTDSTDALAEAIRGEVISSSPGGSSTALRGINCGTGFLGIGVWGSHAGSGYGVYGTVEGNGLAVYGNAQNSTGSSYAGYFYNSSSDGIAVYASGRGQGRNEASLRVNNSNSTQGMAAYMTNNSNYATAHLSNTSTGQVLYVTNGGTDGAGTNGGNFIEGWNEPETDMQFRVRTDGQVRSDVGFATPAADYADMMFVDGDVADYEPGDVLVLVADAQVGLSNEAYATTVIGVYSTNPGLIGGDLSVAVEGDDLPAGERIALEARAKNSVPVAMSGIVPVKVTAENGAIQPGDLLTTSGTPGHAMKAERYEPGTVLGKALTTLDGDEGVVEMLVMMQ